MKSNHRIKSAMTALIIASMLCTTGILVNADESHWIENNGIWSYIKADGNKATGWINEGDCWYAFDDEGIMRTGWIASNEHWYFMGESGVMQSDAWIEDFGSWYFIKGTGVMAKDYVKDGYELLSDGKAIPLTESSSVIVSDPAQLESKVIEGNLYVDASALKEIELSGLTIRGKLVVLGDNISSGKVVVKDSIIETISNQTRGTEVILSGDTEIKNIVLEETAVIEPDKNYKGEVDSIEIQSTVISEVSVEIAAHDVITRTYAPIDINAPVDNLEVIVNTELNINENVKNIQVDESAKDTTVEVAKGSTVGTIIADAPVKIDGKGTVEKVEANVDGVEAGKDTTIKDVEAGKDVTDVPDENKHSSGGSGGDYTPTIVTRTVTTKEDLRTAIENLSVDKINIEGNITLDENETLTIPAGRNVEINIASGFTLTTNAGTVGDTQTEKHKGLMIEGTLTLTGSGTVKNISSYFTIYVANTGNFVLDGASIHSHHKTDNETIKVFGKMQFKSGVIGNIDENIKYNNKIFVIGIGVGQEGKLIMDGGTINSSWFGITTNGSQTGQVITINGGTINNIGDGSNIFYIPRADYVTINGGNFNGTYGGLEMRQGTLTITGGTFTTTNSENNSVKEWGNGESGSFWATMALGKPKNEYKGDLIINISRATINSNADAIVFDTRYNEGNAEKVIINISDFDIIGNVKICEGNDLETWKKKDDKYSYTYIHH